MAVLHQEPDLLPLALELASLPRFQNELVTGSNRRRESSLVLLEVGRVAATEVLQQAMARPVPRVQAVDDHTTEAHLGTRLRVGMEGIVVAIESVQQRGFVGGLVLKHQVGLLALGRGEVDGGRALGTAPVALANVEGRGGNASVGLVLLGVDEVGLGLDDGPGLALVVDTEDLGADLKFPAGGGGREGLEELEEALAVDDAGGVEDGDAGDGDGLLGGVKVDYFGVRLLEHCFAVC